MSETEKQAGDSSVPIESQVSVGTSQEEGLDPGSRAVADALRLTFTVLKLVMICIVAVFLWSGFYTVEENEVAIKLRFGKVQGSGENRVKLPGLHWKWPNPIDEVIKVPASKAERILNINSFWYFEKPGHPKIAQYSAPHIPLRFVQDGYTLTASSGAEQIVFEPNEQLTESRFSRVRAPGADYNIAHSRWRLRYHISDPLLFVEYLWDGTEGTSSEQDGWYAVEKLLRNAVSDAVILVSAHRDIDEIIWESPLQYSMDVRRWSERRLRGLEVGISITDLELLDRSPPLQVKRDFDAAAMAGINAKKLEHQAQAVRNEIINQAGGDAAVIKAEAEGYSKIVEKASEAEAAYLSEVLSKIKTSAQEKSKGSADLQSAYDKAYAELLAVTVDQLYQETLRDVIDNADEVFVIPSTKEEPTEVRMHFSRDATLRPREAEEEVK